MMRRVLGLGKPIRWSLCIGLAMVGWLVLYALSYLVGGIIDYYHPEWLAPIFWRFK